VYALSLESATTNAPRVKRYINKSEKKAI